MEFRPHFALPLVVWANVKRKANHLGDLLKSRILAVSQNEC
jgi:hypothetical protein